MRQLIAQRNEERMEQVLGELKAARAASDVAYAAVVMFTNAYALLNPDRREAADLVKRMQEDLEYFRRYAMPDPRRTTRNPSSPSSRRNSRAIAPRTTART